MASPTTLNAKNLEVLGAERLAALLIEISTGNAVAKRRLRVELAGSAGPAEAANDIRKRLTTIAKARSFADWSKIKTLAADIAAQHRAIMDHVAPADPGAALDLLWQLMACANPVFARSDDSNGHLSATFAAAARDIGSVALAARTEPGMLARRAFDALRNDRFGQSDDLVEILAPALGDPGLAALQALVTAWRDEPVPTPPEAEREVIGWGSNGPMYADRLEEIHRDATTKSALRAIADARGDVDSFIAQFEPEKRSVPMIAAWIAERLLAAGRAEEALATVEAADRRGRLAGTAELDAAHIAVLDALGRANDAQARRWARFAVTLHPDHLRAWLERLPEFEDFDAERKAIAHALAHPEPLRALWFLTGWPALDQASRLVIARIAELDGNHYEILSPAADALETPHPLAATLLHRAMIDFTLKTARTSRYKHAARHLADCAAAARRIDDWQGVPTHDIYLSNLRKAHGRKPAFWAEVK